MSRRKIAGSIAIPVAIFCSATAAAHGPAAHWGYGGAAGPAHWAALEPEFGTCGLGHAQSPIDIRRDAVRKEDLPAIEFAYRPVPLKIIDNGHTIQVNYGAGSFITVAGHRYELVQFHFHKPSEESIDGKRYDMVAHLVHKDAEGHLAVVAVLLSAGSVNPMVAALWSNLPAHKLAEVDVKGVQIDASDLLPAGHAYYTFTGSLTTPPCSEGVTWFVLQDGSTLSTGELDRFGSLYPMNARPAQPLNGRIVGASQ